MSAEVRGKRKPMRASKGNWTPEEVCCCCLLFCFCFCFLVVVVWCFGEGVDVA